MAEILVEPAVQMLLEKLLALGTEEIQLFRGFKNDLKSLGETLKTIQKFLNDASKRDIEKEQAVQQWLYELEDVAYEADNLLGKFNYEIFRRKVEIESQVKRKVCCSFSLSFPGHVAFRREMGHKIKDLNAKLKTVNEKARSFGLQERVAGLPEYVPPVMETNSISVDPIFIGRDDVASQIVDDIIKCSDKSEVSVVSIVGIGGLGKTTLARKVFNSQSIEKHFNEERIWVSVSKKIDNKGLLIKVLESLSKDSVGESLGEEAIIQKLRSKLKDKRYLLVLDDYLNEEKHVWDCFRNCVQGISSSKGNFIIVTTRHQNVASTATKLGICSLLDLSDDDCWEIIKERTFPGRQVPEEFEAIGKEIARRCGGLPLAANVAGGSLQGKESDYWRSFLESSNSNPNDDVVLQVLKVSFHRLPSSLHKKCFAYCSVFPKGEEIWRERLIQLWMAEGFLFGSSEKSDMESRGDDVYHFLLQNFFLHEAVKDEHGRIEYSKMHDRVHDLSCLVAGVDRDDEENVISRVRYVAVDDKHDIKKEQAIYLRTLFLIGWKADNRITNMFLDCKYLHALDLQRTYIAELTSSIDKLIHLRFLDLSYNYSIKRLPDSVCKLFNLQTLRLVSCLCLIELPDRFKLLVGLRHLVLDYFGLRRMPLEIGKLTSLRTLEFFIVGNEEGRRIGELRNLKNLRGKLVIKNLEEVRDKEEAMGANLVEKQNLERLEFWWRPSSREGNKNDYEVLEGLQPHRNLKRLDITNFNGDNFPPWTLRMDLPKLIKIVLRECGKCQEMPTLGHLPFLKILEVDGLGNVRLIGPSFYQNSDEESSRSGVAFPALERLKLWRMRNLTKWVEAPNTGATAFPKLEYLVIWDCPELMTAPSHAFPSLRKLDIFGVKSEVPVTKICSNSGSLEELVIRKNSNLTSLPDTLFYNNRCLQSLEIENCDNLRKLELSDSLMSLGVLKINGCSNLASIQCQTTDYLKGISPLSQLEISGCPILAGLPSEMLKKRTTLDNGMDCLNEGCVSFVLKRLGIGPFSEETGMNESLKGLHEPQSLRKLLLYGKPHWESLPDQLQHLTALTDLRLYDFGMEALPEWFSNMSSLNNLFVFDCEKLMDLSCLQQLTKLKLLFIYHCRLITWETLTDPSSSVAQRSPRAHISHIPNICLDCREIHFQ